MNAAPRPTSTLPIERLEDRRLLSAEPVELVDPTLIPGDQEIGAAPQRQYQPAISNGPGGTMLAVWSDYRTGGFPGLNFGLGNGTMSDIWASRIAADGTLLDATPIPVAGDAWDQEDAKVGWDGTNWLVTYISETDPYSPVLHARRVSADGVVLDQDPIVIMDDRFLDYLGNNISPEGPYSVTPDVDGDGWVVTWSRFERTSATDYQEVVYATRVASNGTLDDPEGIAINGRYGFGQDRFFFGVEPLLGGNEHLMAWTTYSGVYVQKLDANLAVSSAISGRSLSNVNFYQSEVVGSDAGWMLAMRVGSDAAYALRVGTDGRFSDPSAIELTSFGGDPKIGAAWDGQNYVASYSDYRFVGGVIQYETFSRRIPTTGTPGPKVLINVSDFSTQDLVLEGLGNGSYAILGEESNLGSDIAITHIDASDNTQVFTDVSTAARGHTAPQIASDGTNFLSAFLSYDEDITELKAIRFDRDGNPLGDEPVTIVPESWNANSYDVEWFGGRYVVAFIGDGPAGRQLYGQQVGPDGQLIGSPIAMGEGYTFVDSISALGDRLLVGGNFVSSSPHYADRLNRIFDENLVPVTDVFDTGYAYALGGEIATVGGRWINVHGWKTTHDRTYRNVAYTFIDRDGNVEGPFTVNDTVLSASSSGLPAVVSAGPNADDAMIFVSGAEDGTPNVEDIYGVAIRADGTQGTFNLLVAAPNAQVAPRASFDGSQYVVTWIDSRNYSYPNQEQADIYAARIGIDGVAIDTEGFPVSQTSAPEYGPVAASGGGHTFFAFRKFEYEAPFASYRITTRALDDILGPALESNLQFSVNDAGRISTTFSERTFVPAARAGTGLTLLNLTTGQTIDPDRLVRLEQHESAHAWSNAWQYVDAAGNPTPLPNGNYRATLAAASLTDKAGNALQSDVTADFFVLAGDANRDRVVDLADFVILRNNFGGAALFSTGDFNYDGQVDLADFVILRNNFGQGLPGPGGDDDESLF